MSRAKLAPSGAPTEYCRGADNDHLCAADHGGCRGRNAASPTGALRNLVAKQVAVAPVPQITEDFVEALLHLVPQINEGHRGVLPRPVSQVREEIMKVTQRAPLERVQE